MTKQDIQQFGRHEATLFIVGLLSAIAIYSFNATSPSRTDQLPVSETRHFDSPIMRPQRAV